MNEEKVKQNEIEVNEENKETVETRKSEPQTNNAKTKKSRTRMYIVLLFIAIVAIVGYVIYRGEYLEILEIGEEYISIFWQNVNYTAITFGINFIILFIISIDLSSEKPPSSSFSSILTIEVDDLAAFLPDPAPSLITLRCFKSSNSIERYESPDISSPDLVSDTIEV